jgi:DNA-binding transcriptional LysR family regulator
MTREFQSAPDPASLAALLAVLETGSFTAAAETLGVTQPAVSLAIRKLEARFGTSLVLRNRKRIVATQPGTLLAQSAREALQSLRDAEAAISQQKDTPHGRIRLGCHESLAAYALPKFMARFLRAYPDIELTLWNGNSLKVEEELLLGRIDLGLVVNASPHPDMVLDPLFEDAVELMCHRTLGSSLRPAALLANSTLIYVPELLQSQHILQSLKKAGRKALRYLPCSSLELVKSLVLDQVGIGILPRRVAAHGIAEDRLRSLSPPLPRFIDRIYLVRRFDLPKSAAVRVTVDALREHGKSLRDAT